MSRTLAFLKSLSWNQQGFLDIFQSGEINYITKQPHVMCQIFGNAHGILNHASIDFFHRRRLRWLLKLRFRNGTAPTLDRRTWPTPRCCIAYKAEASPEVLQIDVMAKDCDNVDTLDLRNISYRRPASAEVEVRSVTPHCHQSALAVDLACAQHQTAQDCAVSGVSSGEPSKKTDISPKQKCLPLTA